MEATTSSRWSRGGVEAREGKLRRRRPRSISPRRAAAKMKQGRGWEGAHRHGEEGGWGLGLGDGLPRRERMENGGGLELLWRAIVAARRRYFDGEERGNTEESVENL